jgi:hypothetical protein
MRSVSVIRYEQVNEIGARMLTKVATEYKLRVNATSAVQISRDPGAG